MKEWRIVVACNVPYYGGATVEAETYEEACKKSLTKCDQFRPAWHEASEFRIVAGVDLTLPSVLLRETG